MHGLESEYFQRVRFIYLDINDPRTDSFKKQLGFRYQPHLFLLDRDGNVFQQWLGPVGEDQLQEAFDNILQ